METLTESKTAYTYDAAYASCLEYFDGDELASSAWINKYALKSKTGELLELNPDMMHERLASEIARIEGQYTSYGMNRNPLSYQEAYEMFKNFKYIVPQGSPMFGIGNTNQVVSLSNCFVIGENEDSYGAIMRTDEEQVQLMKRRGGVGHDISHLRPSSSPVNNSAVTSSGAASFMERFSNSTREVAQDGRRGALMLTMSVKHPDIEQFIDMKLDGTKVTGANISVKVDDEFMKAAISGKPYTCRFPITSSIKDAEYTKQIDATAIWKKIIHNAWQAAEPGLLFWDKVIEESFADRYPEHGFTSTSTNPCGEIALCPYDSCRLLAINLYSFVDRPFRKTAKFNWTKFKEYAAHATRIMDDIVDLEIEKLEAIILKIESDPESIDLKHVELNLWIKILEKCQQGRRTGIGITAEGDMLAALGYTYGTKKATDFAERVHSTLAIETLRESNNLAKTRGHFKIWDARAEIGVPLLDRIKAKDVELYKDLVKYGRRNIASLTIAPTGTVSLMTQTSSGIEPAFLPFYTRRRKINPSDKNVKIDHVDSVGDSWEEYTVFHHKFKEWITIDGLQYYPQKCIGMLPEDLPIDVLNTLFEKSPYYNATSNDVDWVEKVKMQGRVQKWIDHSISVTVNLPNDATEELVEQVYATAWKAGCKGCTIYRDGSRAGVLIAVDEKDKVTFGETSAPKRPTTLDCAIMRFSNNKEQWIGFMGLYDDKPYEIFTGKLEHFPIPGWVESGVITKRVSTRGKEPKSCYDFIYTDKVGESITIPNLNYAFDKKYYDMAKTFSAILRHGMPLPYVINLIESLNLDGDLITTWKAGVKRMLKKYIKDGTTSNEQLEDCPNETSEFCDVKYTEGCLSCNTCGLSKCS